MSKNFHSLTPLLLYGRKLFFKDAIISGVLFGIIGYLVFESGLCEAAIPVIPLGFIIVIVIPMLFLFVLAKPLFFDMRNPRRNDISFLVGISHAQRVTLYSEEMNIIAKYATLFVIAGSCINLLLCIFFKLERHYLLILGLVVFAVLEILLLSFGATFLASNGILAASKKDFSKTESRGAVLHSNRFLTDFIRNFSNILVSPLRGRIKLVAKRQLIDLFRYDSLNGIAIPFVVLFFTIMLVYILRDAPKQFVQFLFIIGAYCVVIGNFKGLSESSETFTRLSAYSFSIIEVFIGNCYLFLSLTFLFPITHVFLNIQDTSNITDIIGILQFLCSYVYLLAVCGSWHTLSSIPKMNTIPRSFLYAYIIVIIPSVFIPVYGIVFPCVFCTVLFLTVKCIFSGDIYHHRFH